MFGVLDTLFYLHNYIIYSSKQTSLPNSSSGTCFLVMVVLFNYYIFSCFKIGSW